MELHNLNQRIETLPHAFARHRIIVDDQGRPVDYIFLEVNSAFEKMTGLKRKNILGRKVTEVQPGIEKGDFDWIGTFGRVALEGNSTSFEQYSETLKHWYEVNAYSDETNYVTTVFHEITARKYDFATMHKLAMITDELLSSDPDQFDFQKPTDTLKELSGALYAAINSYENDERNGMVTITRAISGVPKVINRASELLGFPLVGRSWKIIPERVRKISGGKLVRFQSLFDTSMGAIGKTQADLLQKLFRLGDVYIIELAYGGRDPVGDIIFFMARDAELKNREAIELYAGQLGSLLGRMQSEKVLRESELKYRTLAENMPGVAYRCLYDEDWTMQYMSADIDLMTGYPTDDFINNKVRSYKSVIYREDSSMVARKIGGAVKAKKPWEIEYRLAHRDGTVRWVQERGRGVLNAQNEVDYLDGLILDISARKKAEEELSAQKNLVGKIIASLPDSVVYIFDLAEMRNVFASKSLNEMLGYSVEEFQAMGDEVLKQLIHPDHYQSFLTHLQSLSTLVEGEAKLIEYMMKNKDGRWLWIENRDTVFARDGAGRPTQTIGTAIDITSRKQAEEALADRYAFQKMIANISSYFVNLTADQFDERVYYALQTVGNYFAVDRSYVYRFSEDGKTYSNTHLWRREGVEGYFEKDQDFPVEQTPWWVSELKNGRVVNIADVADMPEEAALDRADFLSEEIKSILTLPLIWEGHVFGCFGFDAVNDYRVWTAEQIDLLQVVAELISGAVARHEADRQIHILSFHDQLTGLYNRRYFENELKRLDRSREHPIAALSADLDGLKLINDTLGHAEGDRYLRAGAEVLKNSLRQSDILARVGGDEFALLLPRTGREEAEMLAARINRQVEANNLEQKTLPLSISLGLAVSESPHYPLEETFRMADYNMYSHKLQQSKKARTEIVSSLLASLFERNNLAEGESEEVQVLTVRLGQALELNEERMANLALLSQVYDLGKVSLTDSLIHKSLLNKEEELSAAERGAINRHPETGYRIAAASPELAAVADLILKHHESYDGKGYPLGLAGEGIPLENRILSIAIAYSAMTNPRPYAEVLTPEKALEEIKRYAGKQFDPAIVEVFLEMMAH